MPPRKRTESLGPVDTGRRRPLPAPAGLVARVAAALAAFLVVGGVLRLVASPGGGGLVGAKQELYARVAGEVDTVFLGSSHVFRGFVPEEFDESMAAAGEPTHSFNYGVQLPNLVELRYLTRQVLEESDGKVERILFEYLPFLPQIEPANRFLPRSTYWHDVESTSLVIERTLAQGDQLNYVEDGSREHSLPTIMARAFPADLRVANDHAQHFLVNGLMLGRGKDVARGLLGRPHGQLARLAPRRGYLSLENEEQRFLSAGQPDNPYSRRSRQFQADDGSNYLESVSSLNTESVYFGDEEWINEDLTRLDDLDFLRRIAEEVQAAGVEFVLVILPANSCDRELEERLMDELGCRVLRYNLPLQHPTLYYPENRFDSGHLSHEGAKEFSRLLARDLTRGSQ